ncbi:MAG: hypothetical protein ACREP6_12285 [Candidatus Binataceae bacterium]
MARRATQALTGRSRKSSAWIVGPVVGALTLFAVVWFLPELMRYIKMERM